MGGVAEIADFPIEKGFFILSTFFFLFVLLQVYYLG